MYNIYFFYIFIYNVFYYWIIIINTFLLGKLCDMQLAGNDAWQKMIKIIALHYVTCAISKVQSEV